jgi:hypothetical protein
MCRFGEYPVGSPNSESPCGTGFSSFLSEKSPSVDFLPFVPDDAPISWSGIPEGHMNFILYPWHLLMLALSAWINREQEEIIAYLRTENQELREKFGKDPILLNDNQRRRRAVHGVASNAC